MNLIAIWKEKGKILEGIANYVFKREDVEDVVNTRWQICLECEHLDHTGKGCVIPGTQPCCKLCGCSMKFKLRSMASECADNPPRWIALMDEKEEELLNKTLL
jgi:hypothetical protein